MDLETGVLKPLYTFDQHNFVNALTVGDDGIIYFYETEGQYYYALDPVAGTITSIISGISQSAYGDDDGRHDLYYDSFNGLIYHLFTSNSTFYCMYTVNPATSELALVDYVGEMTPAGCLPVYGQLQRTDLRLCPCPRLSADGFQGCHLRERRL